MSPAWFCLWLRPHLRWFLEAVREKCAELHGPEVAKEVAAGCIMDDCCVCAPGDAIEPIIPLLAKRLEAEGACLQQLKCIWTGLTAEARALIPSWVLPKARGQRVVQTAEGPRVFHGAVVDGVPFGDKGFVQAYAQQKRMEAKAVMEILQSTLADPRRRSRLERQVAWTLTRWCIHGRLQHLIRGAYPSWIREEVKQFDKSLLETLLQMADMGGRLVEEGDNVIVKRRMKAAVYAGGWGLREMEQLMDVAYVSAAHAASAGFFEMFPATAARVFGARAFEEKGCGWRRAIAGTAEAGEQAWVMEVVRAYGRIRERLKRAGDPADGIDVDMQRRMEACLEVRADNTKTRAEAYARAKRKTETRRSGVLQRESSLPVALMAKRPSAKRVSIQRARSFESAAARAAQKKVERARRREERAHMQLERARQREATAAALQLLYYLRGQRQRQRRGIEGFIACGRSVAHRKPTFRTISLDDTQRQRRRQRRRQRQRQRRRRQQQQQQRGLGR